ncbi:MAG: lysophospholipase [Duncaniella sp.]|nr:lysophospholipase [Duncaniella sp.]MDE7474683.1 lysophospholipase [Duncaniella sp.]
MQRLHPRTILSTLLLVIALSLFSQSSVWTPDILGDGYEMRHVSQPDDYTGPVTSTIIRKLCPAVRIDSTRTHRGVLYVHGFNDYFFQAEMGNRFVDHGYDFYAVDLRRYGRSLKEGDKPFDIRNMTDYFQDIDSALVDMQREGLTEVILLGHSTGGLTSAYFESREHPEVIKALILNSPFLDWNLGWKEKLIPSICLLGKIWPTFKISQGKSTAYAESLLKQYHGEWDYRTDWKKIQSPPVTAGWIRAITMAQKALRGGKADIRVPILLLYSSASIEGSEWTPAHDCADGVLDVKDIKKYGSQLGPEVTCVRVEGGLHDLVLSAKNVREPLYRYIFSWLERKGF